MYKILKAEKLAEKIFLMDVEAPRVAKHCEPGQFVIVKMDDLGERIPLTICDYDREAGTITIVVQIVGASTEKMSHLKAGDAFEDFVGPLGCPSELISKDIEQLKKMNIVFIAGGLGTAPVYPQVKWMHEHGVDVDVIVGAKNKELIILEEEMKAVAGNLYITTDDGSYVRKGMGTDVLKDLVAEGKHYDLCVAIGPMIMMKFVCELTKKYGKTYALNGLDMEVKKGDIYGFVGPNGAGKTTTLRIISGLLKSDGGDLWLDGVRTTKNILKQKSLIGFVPDFFGVYENLNVIEYLEFFAASYGIYGRAGTVRAREVLEMVELSGKEEQMVDSLSRGIQQRLCLARAMIHKPKLLVLDEPNSGLDPRSRKDFQLLLQRLAREDYTILISSHILSELADLCTSIGVINGGVMVQQGKLENIMLAIDSSNPLRITVLNQVPKALELLRQDPQVSRLSVDENKIAAWFSGSREEEAYLLQKLVDAGILVVSFAREHNSLESLFFHLTGETEQKSRNTETFGNTIG